MGVGTFLCIGISFSQWRKNRKRIPRKDPMLALNRFNTIFQCLPDQQDVTHRYIANRVQSQANAPPITLQIVIVSAKGLRNADTLPGYGLSDPYCTCVIPGKPNTKIRTHVIDD